MPIKINYAGRVAPPTQTGRVPAEAFIAPDGGLGDTAQRAGAQLLNDERQDAKERDRYILHKTDQLEREARHKAQVDEERARRNKAGAAFATYQVELGAAADDITTQLNEGLLKREDADKALQKRIADLKKTHVEPLDPTSQADLADNLIRFDGTAQSHLTKALRDHAKKERAGSFTQLTESLQRMAVKDPAGAVAQARAAYNGEGAALFGADVATKQYQTFQENAYAAHFTERLNGVRRDSKGLSTLEKDVSGNATLDPDKKNILLGRIAGFRETLAAAAARAQDSRLKTLEHQIKAADSLILQGFEPSAQQLSTLATAAKGTPYEPVVQAQIAFANQTSKFRSLPPRGQEAFINDFEKEVRTNPTPDAVNTLGKMRTIFNAQREAVRTDPISFAAQKGLADVQPLDFSKPDTLPDQLMARASVSRGMQAQYGSPLKIVTDEEAKALADTLKGLGPQQKAGALAALTKSIGDPEAVRELAGQLAPKDASLATATLLASRALQTSKGRSTAELYLKGRDALATKTAKIDDKAEIGIRATIAKELEDVYRTPEGRDLAIDASLGIYAALKSEGRDDVKQAIELATGGVMTHNGSKIARPSSYTESMFKDALRRVTVDQIRTTGGDTFKVGGSTITAEQLHKQLPGAQLKTIGNGTYAIQAGAGYVRKPDGQPFLLQVR